MDASASGRNAAATLVGADDDETAEGVGSGEEASFAEINRAEVKTAGAVSAVGDGELVMTRERDRTRDDDVRVDEVRVRRRAPRRTEAVRTGRRGVGDDDLITKVGNARGVVRVGDPERRRDRR